MIKHLLKFIFILVLLGMLFITIPFAIFFNLVMIADSYITQLYRRFKRKAK